MINVSLENAENVVNPPNTPVAKNNFNSCEISPLSKIPKTIPIKKQPKMFTINVWNGKNDTVFACINNDNR